MSNQTENLEIQNIIASVEAGLELDLEALVIDIPRTDLSLENVPKLTYQTQRSKIDALIFRSGKIVCTGATSTDEVYNSLNDVLKKLRGLGIPVNNEPEVKIRKIASNADLSDSLNLNALGIEFGIEDIKYGPEQSPELVYHTNDSEVVILLFAGGKVVISGSSYPLHRL